MNSLKKMQTLPSLLNRTLGTESNSWSADLRGWDETVDSVKEGETSKWF